MPSFDRWTSQRARSNTVNQIVADRLQRNWPRRVLAAGIGLICMDAAQAGSCYRDDVGRIVERQRPGYVEVPCAGDKQRGSEMSTQPRGEGSTSLRRQQRARTQPATVSPLPRPQLVDFVDAVPIPDRWRIVEALGYENNIFDPYNRNVLKADRPLYDDWFFSLSLISDTFYEVREVSTPVGSVASARPGSNDIFGGVDQSQLTQNITTEFIYYKGSTTFKPPDYEFRLTPVLSYNYLEVDELQAARIDPRAGTTRTKTFLGIQAAFIDKHLRNVSERFDFDSFRIGIQPFSSDFRGFLFQDNQLGVRLFGTRSDNKWQYNLGLFRRLEKDTSSGLNDLGSSLREDDVFVANLYRQDFPLLGFTSQATVLYNRNREGGEVHYNKNGFIERPANLGQATPRDYDVVYLGYNGDGHFGRVNLTTSLYYASGQETAGVFTGVDTDISAYFAAAEVSVDFNWIRARLSMLYASGDDNPFDDQANGFDAIVENPQFAGADTSYAIRQSVPFIGGGGVALSTRNGILNNLRSSKDEGQSNFTNPGTVLAGVGVDVDVMPELRLALNFNTLYFAETEVLEAARLQSNVDKHMGYDLSASITWRPLMSQNIVVRAAYATLLPGKGFDALFPNQDLNYYMLNAVLAY
jgi:hypothetical protein